VDGVYIPEIASHLDGRNAGSRPRPSPSGHGAHTDANRGADARGQDSNREHAKSWGGRIGPPAASSAYPRSASKEPNPTMSAPHDFACSLDHPARDHLKVPLLPPVPAAHVAAIQLNHDGAGRLCRRLLRRLDDVLLHGFCSRQRDVMAAVLVQLKRHGEHPKIRRGGDLLRHQTSQHQPSYPCTTLTPFPGNSV